MGWEAHTAFAYTVTSTRKHGILCCSGIVIRKIRGFFVTLIELVTADHSSSAWVGRTSRLLSKYRSRDVHKHLSCLDFQHYCPSSLLKKEIWRVWRCHHFLSFHAKETLMHLPGKLPRESVSGSSLYVSCRRIRAFAAPVSSSSVGKNWRWIVRFAIKPLQ